VGYSVEQRPCLEADMPPGLIKRVVISPFVHPALVQSAKVALRSLDGWRQLTVRHSRLTNNQTWQKALSAFPARHGTFYGPWIETELDGQPEGADENPPTGS
jgi:hypothetical protein